jgi:branched-chain amino acid transport system substrate-binding protein
MKLLYPTKPALLALLALLAGCAESSREPIRIGVAGPIGQANGRSMKLAAEMAAEEINSGSGIGGRRVELVILDDEASPQKAIQVASYLRDSTQVVAVVGHVNSPATLAAATIYNDEVNGLSQISPASSSPLVTQAGPWTFRVCPSDLLHGPAVAGWTYDRLGSRRAAVLYTNDQYGRGVSETFSEAFRRAGGAVVALDPYLKQTAEEGEIRPFLERALARGMDALMIAGQADPGIRIVQAARRMGFRGPVVGADGMTGVKDAGTDAEGIYVSSAFLPDRSSPEAQAFVRAYREKYNELPDHRGAMSYDAVKLLARALAQTGPDRRKLRDYLERVGREGGSPAYDGVSGRIAFDENGDVPGKEVSVGMVRGGQLVSAK